MKPNDTDLLIRIFPRRRVRDPYPVEATLADGSFFQGTFRVDPQALLERALEPAAYGQILCEALFSGPIGRAFERAMTLARVQPSRRLRVRLWIDDAAPELQALPWERLYHYHDEQHVPLSLTATTPFSRYLGLGTPKVGALRPPIHVLFAISNPSDVEQKYKLAPIDVVAQISALHDALAKLNSIHVTLLPGRSELPDLQITLNPERYTIEHGAMTLERLKALLGAHQVLHFLGHGQFTSANGSAALLLENEDGTGRLVRDSELAPLFNLAESTPHLIMLAACESGSASPNVPFTGLGTRLVRAGVPAVVAMQDVIGTDYAKKLTAAFYGKLLKHGIVDQALNEARYDVFQSQQTDWAVPVLYMRLETGQLFAPDPFRVVLEGLRDDQQFHSFRNGYLDLPLQVTRLSIKQPNDNPDGPPRIGIARPFLNVVEEIFTPGAKRPRLAVLLGQHGTNKSTQLKHLIWRTIDSSLTKPMPRVLPLYIDLSALESAKVGQPLMSLVREVLRNNWPDTADDILADGSDKLILRLAFDGIDSLSEQGRAQFWKRLADLIEQYPDYQYLLAARPEHFLPEHQSQEILLGSQPVIKPPIPLAKSSNIIDIQLLLIQPLDRQAICRLLQKLCTTSSEPRYQQLLEHLEQKQLFDLVSLPSFLADTIKQACEGKFPGSRVELLHGRMHYTLDQLPARQGMRAHAMAALCQLAWQMHSNRALTWPVTQALQIMADLRGQRGYALEQFLETLVMPGLLAYVGDEALCFVSPPVQAYCCALAIQAMDDRDRVLDDITASLGRLTRLRWWRNPLICLCNLLHENGEIQTLERLLRMIVYGVNILESEQTLLAARCLAEVGGHEIAPELQQRVIDALIWRLSATNEPRPVRRERAARALGQLRDPETISALVRTANQKVRKRWRGSIDYEMSNVRMAAAIALLQLMPNYRDKIAHHDPQLADVLGVWLVEDVPQLINLLHGPEQLSQALAAFALGDLQTAEAVDALLATFMNPGSDAGSTLWAVTDALTLLDSGMVIERAIQPLLLHAEGQAKPRDSAILQECLAYLIGKTQTDTPEARAYLDDCLRIAGASSLQARAIRAIGELYDYIYRQLFEEIALNDFSNIPTENLTEDELLYLRRVAIETLANIGDDNTVTRLRQNRDGWPPELDQLFYYTSEEIAWRAGKLGTGSQLKEASAGH